MIFRIYSLKITSNRFSSPGHWRTMHDVSQQILPSLWPALDLWPGAAKRQRLTSTPAHSAVAPPARAGVAKVTKGRIPVSPTSCQGRAPSANKFVQGHILVSPRSSKFRSHIVKVVKGRAYSVSKVAKGQIPVSLRSCSQSCTPVSSRRSKVRSQRHQGR